MVHLRLLALLCLVLLGAGPASATAKDGLFAPDSVWNLPVRADAALHPHSRDYVDALVASVRDNGTWLNSSSCGMPLYWADATTPKVAVRLDHPSYVDPALVRAWSAVPIPAAARPARCPDRNFAVAQRQPDGSVRLWEFWDARRLDDGSWEASWGGAILDAAGDRGFGSPLAWTNPEAPLYDGRHSTTAWNVTASSASMMAGVVTRDDIDAGRIDHALAFAVTAAARGTWLFPAQRSDGWIDDAFATPEGAHFRLDPELDLDALKMSPMVRMLAEAAQRYGIVVRDQTGGVNVFILEQPAPGDADLFDGLLDGQYPSTALRAFPWERLQLLDAATCTDYRGCAVTPRAAIDFDVTPERGRPLRLDTSNSVVNYPRAAVSWDLDGDGRFETDGGRRVWQTYSPATTAPVEVGVQITTQDGVQTVGRRTIAVGQRPSPGGTTTSAPSSAPVPAGASPTVPATTAAPREPSTSVPARRLKLVGPSRRRLGPGRRLVLSARVLGTSSPATVLVERRTGRSWREIDRLVASARGRARWSGRIARGTGAAVFRLRLAGAPVRTAATVTVRLR